MYDEQFADLMRLLKWSLFTYLSYIIFFQCSIGTIYADTGSDDVIGDTLCNLVELISGQIARGIATLAIFAIGIGLFMGKVSWTLAATTAAAVGVIFGAGSLVDFFAPDSLEQGGGLTKCK